MLRHSGRRIRLVTVIAALVTGAGMLLHAEPPQAVGTWASIGASPENRVGAASAALPDGRTVIAGGLADGAPTDAIVVFDPEAGSFTAIGQLTAPRTGHTATLLADGRMVIAGGAVNGLLTADIEIVDLSMGTATLAATMTELRSGHAAARLADGTVLIAGGTGTAGVLRTAEIFDPATGSVLPTVSPLQSPRSGASATSLIDGRVLIAGGNDGAQDLASAEIYSPSSQSFEPTDTNLSAPRTGHAAVLLPNNSSVLVAGGSSNGVPLATVELFLPAEFPDPFSYGMGRFAPTGAMAAARSGAAAGPHVDGYAFVTGGGAPDAEVYRFATIKTDKDDYAPGELAVITGSGWQPNEEVKLVFQEDPAVHDDYELTVVADGEGNIYHDQWAPEGHDSGVRFYLMARGSKSRAQTTFTDGNLFSSIEFSIGPSPVTPGGELTWNVSATCRDNGMGNTCDSEGYVHGGPVQDGYRVNIERATNSFFSQNLVTVTTATTTGGVASGSFAAPATGGPYYYRVRHSLHNLPNVPVQGNAVNAWRDQSSDTVVVSLLSSDTTPPVITPNIAGLAGTSGWYISNVSVTWTVTDEESSITSKTGCDASNVTTDTAGVTFTCTATSTGGTASQSVTIKRDATAPVLNPAVSPNPIVLNGTGTAAAGASDATSGVANQSCDAPDASSVGTKALACTATDHAGNSATVSHDYSVVYAAAGMCVGAPGHSILDPMSASGPNIVKPKSTVPAKFRVCDANGVSIGTPGVVSSFAAMSSTGTPVAIESTTTHGAFRWSPSDQQWIFNISTKNLAAGQTYVFTVGLNDGSTIPFSVTVK